MESKFLDFINSLVEIPNEQKEKFLELVSLRHFSKGDFFVKQGQYPNLIGFVTKGLFRYFYLSSKGGGVYQRLFYREHHSKFV